MAGKAWIARRLILSLKNHFTPREKYDNITSSPVRYFSVTQSRNMKFVQFTYSNKPEDIRVGFIEGQNVIDLYKVDPGLPTTLLDILKNAQIENIKKLTPTKSAKVPLSDVRLSAPLHGVDKVICIGLNYKDHCEEQNLTPPEVPMFFSKFASTIIGPNDTVKLRTQVTKRKYAS